MAGLFSGNLWLQRHQCPCGDWNCYYVAHEGELQEATSHTVKHDNNLSSAADDTVAPYVGMVFTNDDAAFEQYGSFARRHGFSVRKERSRLSAQLGVYKRDFVCYRSGFAPGRKKSSAAAATGEKNHHQHHSQRDRKSVRCGCDAKMYLSKEVVNDGTSPPHLKWHVVQFSNVHNHELLEDDQVRLLPAYRKIHEADQERIILLSKAGFPIHRIVKVLELEKRIHGGQLPYLERDVRNFVQNRKRVVQESDVLLKEKRENDIIELLEACKGMKEGDEGFVYDYSTDDSEKVDRIAWSSGQSVLNYSVFGDVVLFETNYESVTYGMILGVWLGIDNNGRVILFGCALLPDNTNDSYAWSLQAFLRFMKGKCPDTIITNLDTGLRDAVAYELPNTKHVIPIWYILPNLFTWFSQVVGPNYGDFRAEFDVLYHGDNAEEFEYRWNQIVSRFGLGSDRHMSLLYALREAWALSYCRGCFLAKMATRSYLKCVDTFLKGIFSSQSCLRSFFEQICHAAASSSLRVGGGYHHQAAAEGVQSMPIRTTIPMEEHARSILSSFAFNMFQAEVERAMQYAASDMANDGSCLVRHFKGSDEQRLIIWIPDGEEIHCSCKEFESSGILCRHAIHVLISKNYFQLPETYYPRRWRKVQYDDGDDGQGFTNRSGGNDEWFHEFQDLTSKLLRESSVTKERYDYVGGQLVRELKGVLDEVRSMPACDGSS